MAKQKKSERMVEIINKRITEMDDMVHYAIDKNDREMSVRYIAKRCELLKLLELFREEGIF